MTGLKIVIPTTFTDATLPVLRDDPILPAAGALALYEPGHPINPLVGVPANAALLPNLALPQAQALTGATAAQLSAVMNVGSTYDAFCIRERTAGGGLHLLTTETAVGDANTFVTVTLGSAFPTYLIANKAHSYFYSLWGRWTRLGPALSVGVGNPIYSVVMQTASDAYTFYQRPTGAGEVCYPTDSRRLGWRASNSVSSTVAPFIQNIGTNAIATAATAITTTKILQAGHALSPASVDYGKTSSLVFYRWYCEDLTVSGRTYATVDALDIAEYNRQVTTIGGRYYGDTYTNPTTLP